MTTISLSTNGTSVGQSGSIAVDTPYYPILLIVTFDYAISGHAIIQVQWTKGGQFVPYGGTLTSNTSTIIYTPAFGWRLNVTQLTTGFIELSILGNNQGTLLTSPTILTDESGGDLLDEATNIPLIKE